jgi:hypothetical protein
MATTLNQIGNGNGYLYETDLVNNIITVRKNTAEGLRDMRQKASVNSPLAANRSAIAVIEITGVAGTGNFTAVTVNGVNQIAGNVAVTTSDPATEAIKLAAAINAYTPGSGPDYTAFAIDKYVYIVEPAIVGGSSNGVVPVVSADTGTITTSVTAFSGGASASGAYDKQFGRKYYCNAEPDAMPDSISGALDITNVITVRSFSSGIETESVTIASDQIQSFPRYSSIIQLKVDTEGGAASDNLVFINPAGMVEGDMIILVGANASHTVNVISQPNASLVSPKAGNIFLSNNTQFSTSGLNGGCLMLRYIYDNTYGGIFVEMLRTSVPACITPVTYNQIRTLILGNALKQGCRYVITDRADLGIICTATSANRISLTCEGLFLNADYQGTGNYSGVPGFVSQVGVWHNALVIGAANQVCIYNNNHYRNKTGVNTSTPPPSDTVNWELLPKSVTTGYHLVSDTIEYDIHSWIDLSLDYIVGRKDRYGNYVGGGLESILLKDPIPKFAWGNNKHQGNTCIDSDCRTANFRGEFKNNNLTSSNVQNNSGTGYIIGNTLVNNNIIGNALTAIGGLCYIRYNNRCNIENNTLSASNAIISDNTKCNINGNILQGTSNSLIRDNSNQIINNNTLNTASQIIDNNGLSNSSTVHSIISGNILGQGATIRNNYNGGFISGNTLGIGAGIRYNFLQGTGFYIEFINVGKIRDNVLLDDTGIIANALIAGGAIYRKTLSGAGTNIFGCVISGNYGSQETITQSQEVRAFINNVIGGTKTIDITGLTTVPVPADYTDLILTSSNPTETVNGISFLTGEENRMGRIRFRPAPGLTLTVNFEPAPGTNTNKFVGPAASRVLNGNNGDMIEFEYDFRKPSPWNFYETAYRISI